MSGKVLASSVRGQGGGMGWFLSLLGPNTILNILRKLRQLSSRYIIIEMEPTGPDEILSDSHIKDCLHVGNPVI